MLINRTSVQAHSKLARTNVREPYALCHQQERSPINISIVSIVANDKHSRLARWLVPLDICPPRTARYVHGRTRYVAAMRLDLKNVLVALAHLIRKTDVYFILASVQTLAWRSPAGVVDSPVHSHQSQEHNFVSRSCAHYYHHEKAHRPRAHSLRARRLHAGVAEGALARRSRSTLPQLKAPPSQASILSYLWTKTKQLKLVECVFCCVLFLCYIAIVA